MELVRFCFLALLLLQRAITSFAFVHLPSSPELRSGSFGTAIPKLPKVGHQNRIQELLWHPKQQCRLPTTFQLSDQEDITGSTTSSSSNNIHDLFFDGRTTAALVGGQSLLIVGSIAAAAIVGTPKFGLGPGFVLNWSSISTGVLLTLPLGVLAALLDLIEDRFPALQDVTKATQRSVLALLGGKFKPGLAFLTSLALGCVAGVGGMYSTV